MTIYKINPVPKPRMTQRDKWAKRDCVLKYRAFKDLVRLHNVVIRDGANIKFTISMPKSWSLEKRRVYCKTRHIVKPDLDNILKGLIDAVFVDDSIVWHIGSIKKVWGYEGAIEID